MYLLFTYVYDDRFPFWATILTCVQRLYVTWTSKSDDVLWRIHSRNSIGDSAKPLYYYRVLLTLHTVH